MSLFLSGVDFYSANSALWKRTPSPPPPPTAVMEEGVKLHTKGRVSHGASTDIDGDYFFFKGGSTGIIKILEPMNPLLNYYEYQIINRGQEASIGIGVRT